MVTANQKYRKRIKEYSEFGIIYKLTLVIDGRCYIGQTIRSLKERISEHSHKRMFYINNAINKYGINNFICEIIEKVDNQINLDIKEKYWIQYYKSNIKGKGFNLTTGGDHCCFNDEVREKQRKKMLGKNNHRYGKKISEETRVKMRLSSLGKNKGDKNGMFGKISPLRKKVRCIETDETFPSITMAAKNKGISVKSIQNIFRGKSKTAGKFHWEVIS